MKSTILMMMMIAIMRYGDEMPTQPDAEDTDDDDAAGDDDDDDDDHRGRCGDAAILAKERLRWLG